MELAESIVSYISDCIRYMNHQTFFWSVIMNEKNFKVREYLVTEIEIRLQSSYIYTETRNSLVDEETYLRELMTAEKWIDHFMKP